MTDINLSGIPALEKFISGVPDNMFRISSSKKETYDWIKDTLNKFAFRKLCKGERGKVRKYIQKVTGYSSSQLSRLVAQYFRGNLVIAKYKRHSSSPRYS